MTNRTITENEIDKFVELYSKGMSAIKISEITGRSYSSIYNKLRSRGVRVRSTRETARIYSVNNRRYFQFIDTPNKAYLLGFVASDGYITSKSGGESQCLGISIGAKDVELLEFAQCEFDTTYPIHEYVVKQGYKPGIHYVRLLIQDQQVVDDLKSHGIVENKSDVLEPLTGIPREYMPDFIRGYIDGDGSIYSTYSGKWESYSVSMVGTAPVLDWISDYLYDEDLIYDKSPFLKRKEEQVVGYVRWGGNDQVYGILKHIYSGDGWRLSRKYNRFLELSKKYSSPLRK